VALQPEPLAESIWLLALPASNAYLWRTDRGRLTLIDTGVPGSAEAILTAISGLGHSPEDLQEIVLTHFHRDHTGSAAELVRRTGARVVAHIADAPIIEGRQPPPKPRLTPLERPLAEMLLGNADDLPGPQPEPVIVDSKVADGDVTHGGGQIVAVPGHTQGSIAVLLPERRVLLTGDTVAAYESAPILGPFNLSPGEAVAAVRRQAHLDFDIAAVGHGRPIVGGASTKLLAMVRSLPGEHDLHQPQVGVGVLVVNDGAVLLGLRQGAHGAGTWSPPGGHLEFGEDPLECVRRETFEETGVQLGACDLIGVTNDLFEAEDRHYVTLFYRASSFSGTPTVREPEKCQAWQWWPWADLPNNLFLPLQHLREQRTFDLA
jgi:glyoxylase-like metal-dependent hydrolase (beta-lactamase superfamily II)/ADP-ribose pyrophosphatase YjhB (NUDIX family)